MDEGPHNSGGSGDDELDHALLAIHAKARGMDLSDLKDAPGFRPVSLRARLETVAEADEEEVPHSTRLDLLHGLARSGFPDRELHDEAYLRLAESVAAANDLTAGDVLEDLERSATTQTPFSETRSGQAMPHEMVAFVGEDVCNIRRVSVDGKDAVWIFSEFETDAPFESVAEWVNPKNWPVRGPMLFKRMELVGANAPTEIGSLSPEHWHGLFHEEVQLIGRVNTLLHCDHWKDDRSAGMTYDLALSVDRKLDVDRGFLLVNDVDGVRRVKALKIVGFTDPAWDRMATLVCPYWTGWVRQAVDGATTSKPIPTGDEPAAGTGPISDLLKAWIGFFGEAAGEYADLFQDFAERVRSERYSVSAWVEDATDYWDRLARDWAKAWTYGRELLEDVADSGLAADFRPPGPERGQGGAAMPLRAAVAGSGTGATARAAGGVTTTSPTVRAESTVFPVPGLGPNDVPVCTALVSIEEGGVELTPSDIDLTVEELEGGVRGVRLSTTNTTAPAGLYVGRLQLDGRDLVPVQIYLSRATGRSSG